MTALKRPLFILVLLLPLLLQQSCVVYHKTPSTLEEAAALPVRTKVTDRQGEKTKYRYIQREDGVYYGVKQLNGVVVRTPLQAEGLEKIQVKNKVASTWLTVGVVALPVATVAMTALVAVVLLASGG